MNIEIVGPFDLTINTNNRFHFGKEKIYLFKLEWNFGISIKLLYSHQTYRRIYGEYNLHSELKTKFILVSLCFQNILYSIQQTTKSEVMTMIRMTNGNFKLIKLLLFALFATFKWRLLNNLSNICSSNWLYNRKSNPLPAKYRLKDHYRHVDRCSYACQRAIKPKTQPISLEFRLYLFDAMKSWAKQKMENEGFGVDGDINRHLAI